MTKPQKMKISNGDKLGSLLILKECGRSKFGHLQYLVRCDCGKEYISNRASLLKTKPCCPDCSRKNKLHRSPKLSVGEIVNNWEVVSIRFDNIKKQNVYICRCQLCGNLTDKNHSEIKLRKGNRCQKCTPDYHFRIKDNCAYGTLPNGEQFIIDAADVQRVSEIFWHMGKDGYIIYTKPGTTTIRLHNFIMNVTPNKKFHIDHINRNRSDCRKCNLRLVTVQQNCMNSSVIHSSATGLRGVTFDKSCGNYKARIGLNDSRIYLGSSQDPVECAQMYNWAAPIIFGEFAGELNDVPEAPEWIKRQVERKCKPYLVEAMVATQPCGFTFVNLKGA